MEYLNKTSVVSIMHNTVCLSGIVSANLYTYQFALNMSSDKQEFELFLTPPITGPPTIKLPIIGEKIYFENMSDKLHVKLTLIISLFETNCWIIAWNKNS